MPKKYTDEQFWKLYDKLPPELKDALWAEETGDNISNICEKNGVSGNAIGDVVDLVGTVLVGVLLPEDFQKTLETDLNIKKDTAKKVAREINRFIFYPVKPALEQLYKMEITPSEKPTEKPTEKPEIEKEKPAIPSKEDAYRELTE